MIFITLKSYNKGVKSDRAIKERFLDIFSDGKPYHYKKGEVIIRPDTPPAGVYFIVEGYVKIYSLTEDGEEKLHIIYRPGEIFPLIWALDEIQKDAFYEALTEVRAKRASKKEFLNFVRAHPEALFELTKRLSAAFEVFVDRVENLEIARSYPRLIDRILFLAKRFGEKEGGSMVIKAPLTHKDIADSIAMSRETASRDISKLEKKGIISYKNHLIEIKNIKELEEELRRTYKRELL